MSSDPVPARAFMGSSETQIVKAIRMLAKEQRHMACRHITVEDMRQMFIPPHLRDPLKIAFEASVNPMADQHLKVDVLPWEDHRLVGDERLVATFVWDWNECHGGFYSPMGRDGSYPLHTLQDDVTPELREKWEYVQQLLGQVSYEWGMVQTVFSRLNTHGFCNTPQQMRFVWPAIRTLVEKAGMGDLAKQLHEPSARAGDRARVPLEITDLMVPSVNIVNRTVLMDPVNLQEKREFRLEMNGPQYVVDTRHSMTGTIVFQGMN